jgi:hypothetical protein
MSDDPFCEKDTVGPRQPISPFRTADPVDDTFRETYAGQAGIAGSGPSYRCCRQCNFWRRKRETIIHDPRRDPLAARPCHKFRELTGVWGTPVPHYALGCSFFVRAARPPPPE